MGFPLTELELAIRQRQPVMLWGAPGVGKTARIYQLAEKLKLPVVVVLASIREPTDFGFPVVRDDGTLHLCPPSWVRDLQRWKNAILFLDELSTAPFAVQAPLLRIIHEKVVGEERLPEEVAIVAAANPPDQAAGGWDLKPPLANRLLHLYVTPDVDEWARWAVIQSQEHALVAAFLRVRPEVLLKVPEEPAEASGPWPSPRSWDAGARLAGQVNDAEKKTVFYAASVGESAALEFAEWRSKQDLPDPETLLADPDSFRIPARADQQFAVLASIAAAVVRNRTRPRWFAAWKLLGRAAGEGIADVAATAALALTAARGDLPIPREELQAFKPLLQAAGLI